MAATGGAIKAGRAYYELFADNSPFIRTLKDTEKRLQAFGGQVTSIGAKFAGVGGAVTAAFVASAKVFADTGSSLQLVSERTGASVEALSSLGFAANLAGTDLQAVEGGITGLQQTLREAKLGSIDAARALMQLGLSSRELAGLSAEKQLEKVADGLRRIPDPARKAAAAVALLGSSDLVPFLSKGGAAMAAARKEAERLGLVMSGADAKAAKDLSNSFMTLQSVLKQLAVSVGAAVAPSIMKTNKLMIDIAVSVGNWIRKNQALVATVFEIAKAVAAAGAVMIGIGQAISAAGGLIGSFTRGMQGTVSVLSKLPAMAAGVTGIFASAAAGAAIGTAGAFYFTGAWRDVISEVTRLFGQFKATFDSTWSGIRDALAAGDLEMAGRIALAGLNVAWVQGLNELSEYWNNFRDAVVNLTVDMGSALATGIVTAFETILTAFSDFRGAFEVGWNVIGGMVEKTINRIAGVATVLGAVAAGDTGAAIQAAQNVAISDSRIDRRTGAANATAMAGGNNRAAAISATAEAFKGGINARADAVKDSFNQASAAALGRGTKAMIDAQIDLAKLQSDARIAAEKNGSPLDKLKAGAVNPLGELPTKIAAVGTFNAQGISGMLSGASSEQQRTAKATEKTAQVIQQLLSEVRNSDGFTWDR